MIRKFIEDNKISFKEGSRNSSVVVLIGYAQHLKMSQTDLLTELHTEVVKDSFIEEEVKRLFDYCKSNNYKKFWTTTKAKKEYKF